MAASPAATIEALRDTFSDWRKHMRALREDTELTVAEALRASHPDHHVTRTNTDTVDLLGFAQPDMRPQLPGMRQDSTPGACSSLQ